MDYIFTCDPGVAFKWPKGVCLETVTEVTLLLPGAILAEDKPIGTVIDAPSDAFISFIRRPDGKGIDSIRLVLKSGQSMVLNVSSMAIASSNHPGAIKFKIVGSGGTILRESEDANL